MITTALAFATIFLTIYGLIAMVINAWQAQDLENLKKDLKVAERTIKRLEARDPESDRDLAPTPTRGWGF